MARLRKLGKSGRYFLYFSDATRTPREKSVALECSDGQAARARAAAVERLVDKGLLDPWQLDPSRLPWKRRSIGTVEAALDAFVEAKRLTCRPGSVRVLDSFRRGFLAALPPGLPLGALAPAHVRAYVFAGDVKPTTRGHRLRHVRQFCRWAHEVRLLAEDADPTAGVKLPRAERPLPVFLTPADIERLLRAADAWVALNRASGHVRDGEVVWLKDVIVLGAYTGLRAGEMAAARWSWVDLGARTLTVRNGEGFRTKSGRERTVPLAGPAWELVARLAASRQARGELADGSAPLLRGPRGSRLDPRYASKAFKSLVRTAKLPEAVHLHTLRHSCASLLAAAGVPAVVIAEVLGHRDTRTTELYTHACGNQTRAAMEKAFGAPKVKPGHLAAARSKARARRVRSRTAARR